MNYEAAIELAKQRMREIGKGPCEYHIDVLSIIGDNDERKAGLIQFKAYNEYLYLIDYRNYFGLTIISDSAVFNSDDYTYNTKLQEHTGGIRIIKSGKTWSIEGLATETDPAKQTPVDFVRVVIH